VAPTDLFSALPGSVQVEPPSAPSNRVLTGLVVGVVTIFALYFGKDVLLPVTLAVLLSFVLSPLVTLLRRIQLPRVVAVVFSVALAIAIIVGVASLLATQFVEIAGDLPRYQTTIEEKVGGLRNATVGRVTELTSRLQAALRETKPQTPRSPQSTSSGSAAPEPAPIPVEVRQPPLNPIDLATKVLLPVVHPLTTLAIMFVVAVFILIQRDDLRDRIIRLFGTLGLTPHHARYGRCCASPEPIFLSPAWDQCLFRAGRSNRPLFYWSAQRTDVGHHSRTHAVRSLHRQLYCCRWAYFAGRGCRPRMVKGPVGGRALSGDRARDGTIG
jgi:AI-2E family transporter